MSWTEKLIHLVKKRSKSSILKYEVQFATRKVTATSKTHACFRYKLIADKQDPQFCKGASNIEFQRWGKWNDQKRYGGCWDAQHSYQCKHSYDPKTVRRIDSRELKGKAKKRWRASVYPSCCRKLEVEANPGAQRSIWSSKLSSKVQQRLFRDQDVLQNNRRCWKSADEHYFFYLSA